LYFLPLPDDRQEGAFLVSGKKTPGYAGGVRSLSFKQKTSNVKMVQVCQPHQKNKEGPQWTKTV